MVTLYLKRSWHWIDYSLVFFRLCWYIINLFIIISTAPFRPNEQYWMVIWFTASYIIPQLFHLPNRISSFGFILSELILTGSLFVWVTNYSAYVIDLMWIPILSIAFLSATRTQWWAAAGISILPLCIFVIGKPAAELFLQYIVALILFGTMGLAFRFLLQKNEEQKALVKELHIKNQQLRRKIILLSLYLY
jgi:hypothetical protein